MWLLDYITHTMESWIRPRNWLARSVSFLIVGGLLLAACSTATSEEATSSRERQTPQEGRPAPDFTLTVYQGQEVLGGEEVQFSELVGEGKPVVLNFWAGLCPPCRIEMPDLESVYQERSEEILLVGLDVGPFTNLGTREDGRALLRELGITYPTGTTFDPGIIEQYEVLGMPSTYFITPDGQIHKSWSGLLTEAKLNELVDELIAASG